MLPIYYDITRFSELDIYLFKEGTHSQLYKHLGSHLMQRERKNGVYFATWAPNAKGVSVTGDFNGYNPNIHKLRLRGDNSGIWEGFIEGVKEFNTYKYHISNDFDNPNASKSDPYAFYAEVAPNSASRIYDIDNFNWNDKRWMNKRAEKNSQKSPICIYEVHLGSWRRKVEENNRYLSYEESAVELAKYLKEMGYTHVEIMPITEFPFEGSWGYQATGYFAPTSRFGEPKDFMRFIEVMHQNNIGVILDWVPSHFVTDGHGLMNFDGTCLYEHKDPRLGYHPQWGSAIFNYDRNETRAFLVSSASLWLEKYHIDGIRVDAVASMLYLDYAREDGDWLPNEFGGNENLGAIKFLRQLNTTLHNNFENIITFAEESTNFPQVTGEVKKGGLGFDYKWNMGWMHDILKYMKNDPLYRQHHHEDLTFSFVYMYNENYILPLSHDEVVHMKGSLINKMPGNREEKFANLRAMYSLMYAHPGKKLLFMGGEFAQFSEWAYEKSLDWHLLKSQNHQGISKLIKKLNGLYKKEPALHMYDCQKDGFEWIDENDYSANVISFIRKADKKEDNVIVVCNFSNKPHIGYRVGIDAQGEFKEIFNSQDVRFDGWAKKSKKTVKTKKTTTHGRSYTLELILPPLSVVYLKEKRC
ncbi:MAG: 1,4-alpha-glucan branching protein GlgB [Sulfurospirillum sp.]